MAHSRDKVGASQQRKETPRRSKPAETIAPAAKPLAPGLYVVATPIGNLRDVTLRALDVLGGADAVYCEDTRVTGKLTTAYGIDAPLHAYHEHNAPKVRPEIIERLKNGEVVALVSDAGTPLISDPGYKLVRECREAGLPVTAIPGPSAPAAALASAGLPTDRYVFAGFLPPRSAGRKRLLADLARIKATLVFFETGPRLAAALSDMADTLGAREAAIARELTKLHEEVRSGPLRDLAAAYATSDPPKGEIVVLVGPPGEATGTVADLDAELRKTLAVMSLKDAVAEVATITGLPRRQVYSRALALAPSSVKLRDPG